MIYIYNAISILILGLFFKGRKTAKNAKKFLLIAFIQMMLIQAIRDPSVGTDTLCYYTIYNNYLHSEYYSFLFTHYEIGFQSLYLVLSYFCMDGQWLLAIISAATMFFFSKFIYDNVEDIYLSTFIFACMFYPSSFNVMRQYLAIAIAINSFTYIRKQQYFRGGVFVVAGALFHSTVILLLLPPIFQQLKNWKLVSRMVIATSAVFLALGDKLINLVLPLIGKSFYLTGYESMRVFRMTTGLVVVFAILTIYLTGQTRDEQARKVMNLLMTIASANVVFGILYLKYEFFSRVIEIMNLFLLVSIPIGLTYAKTKYKPLIRLGVYVLPFLLMLNIVYNSMAGITEYKVFW